jgi:fumarate reductase subunit D
MTDTGARAHAARRLRHRGTTLWRAALLHRVSGIALAVFLPLHFLTLGLAIDGEARLDGFLRWSEAPPVRAGEAILVFLLAVHGLGGLRLLALEFLGWRTAQRAAAVAAVGLAALAAVAYLAVLG